VNAVTRWSAAIFGLLTVLFMPLAASAQPVEQSVDEHRNDVGEIAKIDGRFVHRSSQFVFPAILGDMPARTTTSYGPGDASIAYTLKGGSNGDALITLFVYPATIAIEAEEEGVRKALVQRWSATPVAIPAGLAPATAGMKDGWFKGTVQGSHVTTGYRIAQRGDWYLKARFTIPQTAGQAGIDRTVAAIGAIPWQWVAPKTLAKVAAAR